MKQLLEDMYEEKGTKHLAEILGVTATDLEQCEYEILEDQTNDGLTTGYRVKFDKSSPSKILSDIGVDENNEVALDTAAFSSPDED